MKKILATSLILLLLALTPAIAQDEEPPEPYSVFGYVYTENGSLADNATVTITNLRTGEWITNITKEGKYLINLGNLPNGYEVGDEIRIRGTFRGEAAEKLATVATGTSQIVNLSLFAPPIIFDLKAEPSKQKVNGWVNITVKVTDNIGVNIVKVNIVDPQGSLLGNFTMTGVELDENRNGTYYYNSFYTTVGTYSYFVWANDLNEHASSSSTQQFQIVKEELPIMIWIIIAIAIISAALIVFLLLWRRKRALKLKSQKEKN